MLPSLSGLSLKEEPTSGVLDELNASGALSGEARTLAEGQRGRDEEWRRHAEAVQAEAAAKAERVSLVKQGEGVMERLEQKFQARAQAKRERATATTLEQSDDEDMTPVEDESNRGSSYDTTMSVDEEGEEEGEEEEEEEEEDDADDEDDEDDEDDGGGGGGDDDGDDGGGSEGEGEAADCADDDECAEWQICEEEECVDGDRNNSTDEAEVLNLLDGSSVSTYINKAGDADYYSFSSEGGLFIFAFTDDHEDVGETDPVPDTFMTLFDPEGNVVTSVDDFPNGASVNNMDSSMWAYLNQPGTYTLKVEDANPFNGNEAWGGREYTYTLNLETWSQATYGETSVDSPATFGEDGLTLAENTYYAIGVVLENVGDVDYIAVNFPYNDALMYVDGMEDLSGTDLVPVASILTAGGSLMAQREDVGPDGPVIYPQMDAGPFMISVQDSDGGGGSTYWTVLIVKAGDEEGSRPGDSEANDTDAQATTLEMTETENSSGNVFHYGKVRGAMDSVGDVDFWEMEVSPDAAYENEDGDEVQYLVVCMNSAYWGSSISPDMVVYDADGNELASSAGDAADWPENRIENVEITPGGPVYVAVTAGEENLGGPDEWYFLNTYIASFPVLTYEEDGYSCP